MRNKLLKLYANHLPAENIIKCRGVSYRFHGVVQEGLDRGKIKVSKITTDSTSPIELKYASEFGMETR